MKRASILMTLTALLIVAAFGGVGFGSPGGPAPPPEKLVVHEWGTFLSVQGSDGATLGGMVDSEEALPRFVMERTESAQERAQTRWRSKIGERSNESTSLCPFERFAIADRRRGIFSRAARLDEQPGLGHAETDVAREVGVPEPAGHKAFLGPWTQKRGDDEYRLVDRWQYGR